MANYTLLFKTTLQKNIAKKWLAQANQIFTTINENTQMLYAQSKL